MATKQWMCLVRIEIEQFGVEAKTKEEFIRITKELFLQEYNIELDDSEIKRVQEIAEED